MKEVFHGGICRYTLKLAHTANKVLTLAAVYFG